jgi:hypothetical protein
MAISAEPSARATSILPSVFSALKISYRFLRCWMTSGFGTASMGE